MKGYIFMGVDDEDKSDNLECAYALSLSLKLADPERETCVVVADFNQVPKRLENGFDYIVELPFGRSEPNHHDILIDFWQVFYCTPFEQTIYIDRCSLALDNMSSLWSVSDRNEDIVFGTARDFRGDLAFDSERFVAQTRSELPAFKADLIYFSKDLRSSEFFKMADPVFKGWRDIYREYIKDYRVDDFDYTLMVNIVAHLIGEQYFWSNQFDYTDLEINFLFDPDSDENIWLDRLDVWVTDDPTIKINNHNQHGLFHYGDPDFLKQETIEALDARYRKTKKKINS